MSTHNIHFQDKIIDLKLSNSSIISPVMEKVTRDLSTSSK